MPAHTITIHNDAAFGVAFVEARCDCGWVGGPCVSYDSRPASDHAMAEGRLHIRLALWDTHVGDAPLGRADRPAEQPASHDNEPDACQDLDHA